MICKCYVEAIFGPLEKRIKKGIDINREKIFQKKNRYTFFDHNRNGEILKDWKV
jgi:hypothetical protein